MFIDVSSLVSASCVTHSEKVAGTLINMSEIIVIENIVAEQDIVTEKIRFLLLRHTTSQKLNLRSFEALTTNMDSVNNFCSLPSKFVKIVDLFSFLY